MITEYLKENNLIICPIHLQKSVIQEINQQQRLISYKIMDLSEFNQNYFFSYNKKTVYHIMNQLKVKYDIALEYINALYYVENKTYHSNKLNELVSLKQELEEKELFIKNPFFHYYLEHTSIFIYGYDFLDEFYENLLVEHLKGTWIKEKNSNQPKTVYEFLDIEEEIAFICEDIKRKLDNHISIDHIKIINPSDEYLFPLKRIFSWCHLPLDLENQICLYHLPLGKKILERIKKNQSFQEILEKIQEEFPFPDMINQVISIFNDYASWDIETRKLYDMIEYDLKHTFLKTNHKENSIKIVSLEELLPNDYGYLLGLNKENYPRVYQDEEFLSDSMKEELKLFTSNQRNSNSILKLKNDLNRNANLIITYKLKTAFETYSPCLLIKEEMNVVKNRKLSFQISNLFNEITLAKEYDKFYQYGIHSEQLDLLRENYQKLNYRTYQNQFTGIDNQELLNTYKKPFILSYSALDEYYHCAFRYYISHILNIKEEIADEFYMDIGNIFHLILSKCFSSDFDFEETWNQEIQKYSFSFTKQILLEKLKKELQYDIEMIKKQKNYSQFNEYLYEKRFVVPISNQKNIPVELVGIVDKISYLKQDNRTLVSVIDYKTGHLPSNLNNIIYGLGMQLPIYLYFIKRSNLFPNLEIVGFYLQKIINKEMKVVPGKTLDELKESALKLVGYSTDQEEYLEKFDITYQDSAMIQSLKKKNEGFYAYSKVLNSKQMEKIDELVEDNIKKATNSILNGEFYVNPKKIDKDKVGCEFCSYRDICYKTESDFIELEKHQNLDFLGGDSYAEVDS